MFHICILENIRKSVVLQGVQKWKITLKWLEIFLGSIDHKAYQIVPSPSWFSHYILQHFCSIDSISDVSCDIVDVSLSLYVFVHMKIIPWKLYSQSIEFSSYLPVKFLFFLKSRLLFNVLYGFCMFVNRYFIYLKCTYLE